MQPWELTVPFASEDSAIAALEVWCVPDRDRDYRHPQNLPHPLKLRQLVNRLHGWGEEFDEPAAQPTSGVTVTLNASYRENASVIYPILVKRWPRGEPTLFARVHVEPSSATACQVRIVVPRPDEWAAVMWICKLLSYLKLKSDVLHQALVTAHAGAGTGHQYNWKIHTTLAKPRLPPTGRGRRGKSLQIRKFHVENFRKLAHTERMPQSEYCEKHDLPDRTLRDWMKEYDDGDYDGINAELPPN